jgi:hypothetical protein
VRSGPGQSAVLPNELHLPPNCGHDDPSLTPEGGRAYVWFCAKVKLKSEIPAGGFVSTIPNQSAILSRGGSR